MRDDGAAAPRRGGRRKEYGSKISTLLPDDLREFIDAEAARERKLPSDVVREMLHEARIVRLTAGVRVEV